MKYLLVLLLVGCNWIDPPTHVTEDLQPFVDRVVYEYNIRGVNVRPIKVVIDDLNEFGITGRFKNIPWDRKIIVDRNHYINNIDSSPEKIQKTIAHEFGHYMGRDHKRAQSGCNQISLMCTYCSVCDLNENWEYYFDELVGVTLNK